MWLLQSLFLLTTLASLRGFNLDTTRVWLTPPPDSGRAPRVQEVKLHWDKHNGQSWLLVTGPWKARGPGHFHNCTLSGDSEILCEPLQHVPTPRGLHHQVSVARDSDGTLVVCAQVKRRGRLRSLVPELNGACSLLGPDLTLRGCFGFPSVENPPDQEAFGGSPAPSCLPLDPAASGLHLGHPNPNSNNHNNNRGQEALEEEEEDEEEEEEGEGGTEIAIVLDGSGSINPPDFQKAKDFIHRMMKNFYEKCFECHFAVVQYGEEIKTEFDLKDNRDISASLQKVQDIVQVGSVTKTASAIQHVLDSIFTPTAGSREKASKVIVVLTDGDIFQDPLNLSTVIHSPHMEGIERFAIGVGNAFNNTKANSELQLIASDPDETHVFKVTDYSALDGLLGSLEQRIIRVEGTVGEALQYELAQIGFSAHVLGKEILLGAVGAFDWSGGVMLYNTETQQLHFINESTREPNTTQYSYLGYSLTTVTTPSGNIYLAGAPRHSQRGKVLAFRKDSPALGFFPVLEGEQMGSYFGSELCSLDVDMDGITDHLLVAAPFYHIHGEEGKVYVYRLDEQGHSFTLAATLRGQPRFTFARFGFAVAAIGDLNGDNLGDVAIGAPLEGYPVDGDGSFGSIYIYNGHPYGITSSYSQWVKAAALGTGLKYFGVSLDGGVDLTRDDLSYVSVGSLGRAVVLRSKPVFRLRASMTFDPSSVKPTVFQSIWAKLCFEVTYASPSTRKVIKDQSLNVILEIDVDKQQKRIQSENETSLRWPVEGCDYFRLTPTEGEVCEYDCFSNITVKVSYHLSDFKPPHPILDKLSNTTAFFELPFEKDCKNKWLCVADLKLTAHLFPKKIVVGVTKEVTMNIRLANEGEDSYMTNMTLIYPPNLQLKRIHTPPWLPIQCEEPTPTTPVLALPCKIGYSLFKRSHVNISITWQPDGKVLSQTAGIAIHVTNANGQPPVTEKWELPLKYALPVTLNKPHVVYVNTSQGPSEYREFQFNILGENPFGAEFGLEICVPAKAGSLEIMELKNLKYQDSATCERKNVEAGSEAHCPEGPAEVPDLQWLPLHCPLTSAPSEVRLGAELYMQRLPGSLSELSIPAKISFDEARFESTLPNSGHWTTITIILLKAPSFHSTPIIIGSIIGGVLLLAVVIAILWKCGFFKRKYRPPSLASPRASQNQEALLQAQN